MIRSSARQATLPKSTSSNPAELSNADVPAFEELYQQHSTRLFNLAWRMCGTRADAEDLLQEIFLLAFRKLPDFRGDSAVGTWLYRLAMNRCLDHLKSRHTRARERTSHLDDQSTAAPHLATDGGIKRLDLERAIAQLPEGARAAFLLHDVEGFQHHEVAAILGISEGTSKSQVHKARLRLRALLTAAV
jgi:RNA polymerase sigma-70 factor (ECF subfamily)